MRGRNFWLWLARLLIGLVLFVNIHCALAFLCQPARYAPGFELEGVIGESLLRGMGVLFLMWNVPYLIAFIHPIRHKISLIETVVMQSIGLVGEGIIYLTLPQGHMIAQASIQRFIIFDGAGLVALIIALWSVQKKLDNIKSTSER